MDLSNAFNSIDRSAVRSAVRRVVPALAPWVDFCYDQDTPLMLGLHRLASGRGVHQGDPLGPALFALAIQECIHSAREETISEYPNELDFVAFYLDDGVLGGTSRATLKFCEKLERQLLDVGLTMQRSKCKVIPAAGHCHGIPEGAYGDFDFDAEGNFELLGAPFGSAAFCCGHTRKRKQKGLGSAGADRLS